MSYVTGAAIRKLREKNNMTQKELADKLSVSDKTISKWETARGLPDVSILTDLSSCLGVSIAELLTGELNTNENISANLRKMSFYVCPVCGNIISSVGYGTFSCCGVTLPPLEAEAPDLEHSLDIQLSDGDYFVTMNHPMSKDHYISFISYVTSDSCEIAKLYPEQDIHARFRKKGHGTFYIFCNRHGMFSVRI